MFRRLFLPAVLLLSSNSFANTSAVNILGYGFQCDMKVANSVNEYQESDYTLTLYPDGESGISIELTRLKDNARVDDNSYPIQWTAVELNALVAEEQIFGINILVSGLNLERLEPISVTYQNADSELVLRSEYCDVL